MFDTLNQVSVTLAQVTRIYSDGFLQSRRCALLIIVLLLDLDDVNAEALLVIWVDPAKDMERLRHTSGLRHNLSPRLFSEHVDERVVDANRLDPHRAGRMPSLESQHLSRPKALDAVVADTNLQGLATRHDRVVVRLLNPHLTHGTSFLEAEPPLLHHAVRCVSSREHSFESPAVTLEAGNLPRFRDHMDIQLVTIVLQQSLQVDNERLKSCFRLRHERHQLDGLPLLRSSPGDTDHLTVALSDEDDLELGVDVARFHTTVASKQGVNPSVVHSFEIAIHLRQDESSRAVGVLTLVKRNHRDVRRVEPRLVDELLVQHVLIDANLVVVLRRASDVEALPEEELKRLLVGRRNGAVQLSSAKIVSEIFSMLEQHASDSQFSTVVGADDQRADLGSPLFLVDNVDEANLLAVLLSDEHVLSSGELTDMVDTTIHVCLEDALCMRTVISVVERRERPDHKLRDEIEVVRSCGAHNDVAD